MKQRERRKENDAGMLAQSCCAGVASGDGRHLHTEPNQELVLDDGSAIRFATVLRTASAPLKEGRCATTGQPSCPNLVGPQRTLVHCVRSKLLPTSPRAMPLDPSAVRGQRWFPGVAAHLCPFPLTKSYAPGPLDRKEFPLGTQASRPTVTLFSDQR